MKTTRCFMLTLLMLLTLFSPNAFTVEVPTAQDFPHILLDDGGDERCSRIAFSPDGTILAAGMQSVIHLWDVETAQLFDTLALGEFRHIKSLAFSPDGQILASGAHKVGTTGAPPYIRLWDVATGDLLNILHGASTNSVLGLEFSPDGTILASVGGSGGEELILWDVAAGTRRVLGRGGVNVAFSPDGKTLASGDGLWDVATGELRTSLKHGGGPGVAFSPNGKTLASVSSSATRGGVDGIYLWNLATGEHLYTINEFEGSTSHSKFDRDVAFSPDGKTLVISNWTENIFLFNAATGEPLYTLRGELAAFSPDGTILAGMENVHKPPQGFRTCIIRLWNTSTRVNITPLPAVSPPTGEHLTVNLSITSGENVGGYQAIIGFNPTTLRYVDSENGGYLPPGAFFVPPVVDRNRVTIGATSLTGSSSGDGTLATLTFEVLAVKESRLGFQELLLTNPGGTSLINFTTNGQVTLPLTSATVSIVPSSVLSPLVGEHLVLSADIADGQNVADYKLIWHYDDTALRYVSETKGDYIPPGGVGNGDGTLVTLTLEVLVVRDSTVSVSGFLTAPNGDTFAPTFEGAEIRVPVFGDVNRDGKVSILDLILVAQSFGQTVTKGGNPADVNEDGVVNIVDLVTVAGVFRGAAAAPAAHTHALGTFTASELQQWLAQAQHLNLMDATSQRGILLLEQLLAALTPKETALLPNYPNPFNPETWIPYQLAEPADVTLSIHTADGTLVRTLALGHQPIGIYQNKSRAAYWDGNNQHGKPVASGVYFYTLNTGHFSQTKKMLILK